MACARFFWWVDLGCVKILHRKVGKGGKLPVAGTLPCFDLVQPIWSTTFLPLPRPLNYVQAADRLQDADSSQSGARGDAEYYPSATVYAAKADRIRLQRAWHRWRAQAATARQEERGVPFWAPTPVICHAPPKLQTKQPLRPSRVVWPLPAPREPLDILYDERDLSSTRSTLRLDELRRIHAGLLELLEQRQR